MLQEYAKFPAMAVNNVENQRVVLIGELNKPSELVVAGGIRDITDADDYLRLFAALKDPGEDLRRKNYGAVARRINEQIRRLQLVCGQGGGLSYCSPPQDNVYPDPDSMFLGHLGVERRVVGSETEDLRPDQQQLLIDWGVFTYGEITLPGPKRQPYVEITEVLFYPHPFVAELQGVLYDRRRRDNDEYYSRSYSSVFVMTHADRIREARRRDRHPDRLLKKEVLEAVATHPGSLPNIMGPLLDFEMRYWPKLRFNPLKPPAEPT